MTTSADDKLLSDEELLSEDDIEKGEADVYLPNRNHKTYFSQVGWNPGWTKLVSKRGILEALLIVVVVVLLVVLRFATIPTRSYGDTTLLQGAFLGRRKDQSLTTVSLFWSETIHKKHLLSRRGNVHEYISYGKYVATFLGAFVRYVVVIFRQENEILMQRLIRRAWLRWGRRWRNHFRSSVAP